MQVVLATANPGKLRELQTLLADAPGQLVQIDRGTGAVAVRPREQMAAPVDVEIAVAPVRNVVGEPRLLQIPIRVRLHRVAVVRGYLPIAVVAPGACSPGQNPVYNRRPSIILKPNFTGRRHGSGSKLVYRSRR